MRNMRVGISLYAEWEPLKSVITNAGKTNIGTMKISGQKSWVTD